MWYHKIQPNFLLFSHPFKVNKTGEWFTVPCSSGTSTRSRCNHPLLVQLQRASCNVYCWLDVMMVKRKVNCPECLASLTFDTVNDTHPHSFCLLNRKKWGSLIDTSSNVIFICNESERLLSHCLAQDAVCFAKPKFTLSLIIKVKKCLFSRAN